MRKSQNYEGFQDNPEWREAFEHEERQDRGPSEKRLGVGGYDWEVREEEGKTSS